jgi:outer membrane protein assembly factor BamB
MLNTFVRLSIAAAAFLFAFSPLLLTAENWPRFRGPTGQGISAEQGLPIHWGETENIAWKTAIPGEGWSSPVVYGDRVFVTSTTDEGRSCHVICVDRRTGDILWNTRVFDQVAKHMRPQNSHATPTPVTDGRHVYAVFSAGGIAALDVDGIVEWTKHEVEFFSQHGLGASPVLHGDLLIMPFDGSDSEDSLVGFKTPWNGAVLLALDKDSGQVRWRSGRGLSRLAHVTPQVVERDGLMQLVSAAGDAIQGHNVDSGELIWTVYSRGEGVTPSVVVNDELVYSCSGFDDPTIRAVRFGGQGNVTDSHIEWEQKQGVPSLSSLLYVAPYVYSVTNAGIANCFDARTGDQVWQKRIGGEHSASPVHADGLIYFLSETEGESVVIEAGPKYKEVARNRVGEMCKASMAVSQGNLFIRSDRHLFCIGAAPSAN